MARPIVIYYDGNDYRVAWGNRDYLDSSQPFMHGIEANGGDTEIIAVIDPGEHTKEDECNVFIDETLQIMEDITNVE